MVIAHPIGEWVIETAPPATTVLPRLASAPLVRLVPPPIDGWKQRKIWTVNGLHIVLALAARLTRADDLPLDGQPLQGFLAQAEPLRDLLKLAVQSSWPDVPYDSAYVAGRIQAFCEFPDTTERVIGKYLRRDNLVPFMDRFSRRIGDAAREVASNGGPLEPFAEVASLVEQVLKDSESFYPPEDPQPLDPDVDERVVMAWRDALAGWLDPDEIDVRSRSLRRTLEAQRDLWGPYAQSGG